MNPRVRRLAGVFGLLLSLASGCGKDDKVVGPESPSNGGSSSNGGGTSTPILPDLAATRCPQPAGVVPIFVCGTNVSVAQGLVEVTNVGTVPLSPPIRVDLGIYDGFSGKYWILKSWSDFTNNAIWYPNHKYFNAAFTTSIPCNVPAGSYQFTVYADPASRVSESDEGNNEIFSTRKFALVH